MVGARRSDRLTKNANKKKGKGKYRSLHFNY